MEKNTQKKKFTRHKIYVVHHLGYVHRVAAIFHYKIGRLQRWHENTLTNPNPKYPNKLFVLKNNNREIFSLFFLSRSTYRRTTLKISSLFLLLLLILLTYKAYIYNRLNINFNKSQPIVHTQFQHCQHNLWPNLQVANLYDLWRFMGYHPM
jgi:hypothetical protein